MPGFDQPITPEQVEIIFATFCMQHDKCLQSIAEDLDLKKQGSKDFLSHRMLDRLKKDASYHSKKGVASNVIEYIWNMMCNHPVGWMTTNRLISQRNIGRDQMRRVVPELTKRYGFCRIRVRDLHWQARYTLEMKLPHFPRDGRKVIWISRAAVELGFIRSNKMPALWKEEAEQGQLPLDAQPWDIVCQVQKRNGKSLDKVLEPKGSRTKDKQLDPLEGSKWLTPVWFDRYGSRFEPEERLVHLLSLRKLCERIVHKSCQWLRKTPRPVLLT